MVLIIGGAYQGKLDYARQNFALLEEEIHFCQDQTVNFEKRCIYALEEFTYACIRENMNPIRYFQENRDFWQDAILICQDIFCGVVPMDVINRRWRQETGRLSQYLSKEADSVIRVFCGLEQRLK